MTLHLTVHHCRISSSNLYRYNGKEEQQIAGTELAVLDYGARTYDPWLSRWTSIDPLAAKYYSTSPYVFCNNSPVNFVDFDGRRVKPKGNLELDIIKNTLPKGAREYVRLNSTGFIDQELIN